MIDKNSKAWTASEIVARLDCIAKERGLTINALCESAGVNPSTLYSDRNRDVYPKLSSLKKILDELQMSFGDFFADEPKPLPLTLEEFKNLLEQERAQTLKEVEQIILLALKKER